MNAILKKHCLIFTIFFCGFFLVCETQVRKFVFFKDYAIIWEGAYRIYLGQIPFIDFSTPVGPVGFLIPSLFFYLLGPTWSALIFSQLFQNLCLLLTAWRLLKNLDVPDYQTSISLILFSFLYLVFLSHPWYNSTATLFLLLALEIIGKQKLFNLALAGIYSAIAFLAKQDIGLIALTSILTIIIFVKQNDKQETYFYKIKKIIIFIIFFTFLIIIFCGFIGIDKFNDWIALSLLLAKQRSIKLTDVIQNLHLLIISIIYLYLFVKNKEKKLLFSVIIFISAFILTITKSLFFTNYFYILFTPLILSYIFKKYINFSLTLKIIAFFALIYSILIPAYKLVGLTKGTVLGHPEPYTFNAKSLKHDVQPFPSNLSFFYKAFAPLETITLIKRLKEITFTFKKDHDTDPKVLNISEITPIYAELGLFPPHNLPLWFDPNISLLDSERDFILQRISTGEFDIIVFQSTYGSMASFFYIEIFNYLMHSGQYKAIISDGGMKSPSTSISDCNYSSIEYDHHVYTYFCMNNNIFTFIKKS